MRLTQKQICWLGLMLVVCGILNRTSLHWNISGSLPERAFLVFKDLTPQKGDYVLLHDFASEYGQYPFIVKRLMGVAGDKIIHRDHTLYVNETKVGGFLEKTQRGDPLTPLSEQTIPEGFVFVGANHPDSFDTRYREFGLVPLSYIRGFALGIL